MFFNKGLLILCGGLLISSAPLLAQSLTSPVTHFSIKPYTCIVNKLGDTCQLTATVEWQAMENINVCLYQDNREMFCWNNVAKGKKVLPVNISETTQFVLSQKINQVLASQKVKIASATPMKKRRRLRSDWSIF